MRSKVTEAAVILPRQWFPGVLEVEIRRENDRVVVQPFRPDDPIRELGRHPITTDVDDASLNQTKKGDITDSFRFVHRISVMSPFFCYGSKAASSPAT